METVFEFLNWLGLVWLSLAVLAIVGFFLFEKWLCATPEENEKLCRVDEELERRRWEKCSRRLKERLWR